MCIRSPLFMQYCLSCLAWRYHCVAKYSRFVTKDIPTVQAPKMAIPAPDLESFRHFFIWITPESILIALHSHVSSFGGKPCLTPDQLVELARQSTNPKPNELASPPVAAHDARPVPTIFPSLPDDIYLPFIERPAEIPALISSPLDIKLFSLLAQANS